MIEVFEEAEAVADAVATRLVGRVGELLASRPEQPVHVGLTGGTVATMAYRRLGALPAATSVEWSRVHLWWSDERWVAADSADRNDVGARAGLGGIAERAHLHPMPARDEDSDLDQAARRYAVELGDTVLDVCLLGIGPDGHIASLFPHHPDAQATGAVVAVRNSPKPPPERLSMTGGVINSSSEIWFAATGEEKSEVVRRAIAGDPELPSGRARGRHRTLWFLDRAAARSARVVE